MNSDDEPTLPDFHGRFLISALCDKIATYLPPEAVSEVYAAFLFAAEAHDGQVRRSGEAYIYHPMAVAGILSGMRLDTPTLIAAILHDVIEDTPVTRTQVAAAFGEQVATLVDAVSKFKHIPSNHEQGDPNYQHKDAAKAATLHKLLMAMTRDVRVMLVKLADRLHNIRTIQYMKPASQRRIAAETLEIYTPVAERLCLGELGAEMEDRAFEALHPLRYQVLKQHLDQHSHQHHEALDKIQHSFENRLSKHDIVAKVRLLPHQPYRVYRQLKDIIKENKAHGIKGSIKQLQGTFCYRIVVEDINTCYRVLGLVHSLYTPLQNKIRDHIALPKPNQYRALHTRLLGTRGLHALEVQILTPDMDRFAKFGIINQNYYQVLNNDNPRGQTTSWMQGLQDLGDNTADVLDFMEQVKINLFPGEVYVFTPNNDIIELPHGATVIDFAYAIHSDIGNHLIAAKVDNSMTNALRTPLKSGQRVEVRTASWAAPKPEWLNCSVTAKARTHIRKYLTHIDQQTAANLGRNLLDNVLQKYQLSLDGLNKAQCAKLQQQYQCDDMDCLYADIGLGKHSAYLVAQYLALPAETKVENSSSNPVFINGTEGMSVSLAQCCQPLPGDRIRGQLNSGRGLVIHTQHCPNYHPQHQDEWLNLSWAEDVETEFSVDLDVEVDDKHGSLGHVATSLGELGINILHLKIRELDGVHSVLQLQINVRHSQQLHHAMNRLRRLPCVYNTHRKQIKKA